jgi:hypothetical protein
MGGGEMTTPQKTMGKEFIVTICKNPFSERSVLRISMYNGLNIQDRHNILAWSKVQCYRAFSKRNKIRFLEKIV